MPHDLDGTWCMIIGTTLGYALLVVSQVTVLRVLWRRQSPAIDIMLTCGGSSKTPTCSFADTSIVRERPSAARLQACSHLVVRVSARSSDAGLQVEKKTLKDCNSLVMTESFHHGRAEFECASHWRLKGPDVVPCLGMRGDVDLRWCYEGVRETVTRG
jgi:hypothetical protein